MTYIPAFDILPLRPGGRRRKRNGAGKRQLERTERGWRWMTMTNDGSGNGGHTVTPLTCLPVTSLNGSMK